MGFLNRKKTKIDRSKAHLNYMAGLSYDITNPLLRLRLAASSCFFGEPMYYQRDVKDARPLRKRPPSRLTDEQVGYLRALLNALDPQAWRSLTPALALEQAIDAALDHDPAATLQEAVRLRQEDHIRTTPQVMLVRAAHHAQVKGTGLIRQYAPDIIARADEPAVGLAYQMARYGKPIPNALKKAWRAALESASPYALAKYRMENREVKTVDVINLVHAKSAAVDQLARGTLKLDLAENATWEALLSAKGASQATWTEALEVMGPMALLRNLRNLLQHGVPVHLYADKLVQQAPTAQQLPFRYYSAYRAVQADAPPRLLDALEAALLAALGTLPRFAGRVMSLCDNSGSARGTTTSSMGTMPISTIANLTAVLTALQADEGHVGVFGDTLATFAIRQRASLFDQLQHADKLGAGVGGGTENGIWLFWRDAIAQRQHWDMVFIYSDMQAGHGGLYGRQPEDYADYRWTASTPFIDVPKLVQAYRQQVNPHVLVFLVQVAGYQDTIMPEFYDKTYILGGWSEGLLRFAAQMANFFPAQ